MGGARGGRVSPSPVGVQSLRAPSTPPADTVPTRGTCHRRTSIRAPGRRWQTVETTGTAHAACAAREGVGGSVRGVHHGPLALAAVAVLAVTSPWVGTSAAVASGPAVTRSVDGTPEVDLRLVDNVYRGQAVDLATVERLNADGRATVGVASHEPGCQGVMLWFDTEADAYGRGYLRRLEARGDAPRDTSGDPCADVADAPQFRSAG